MISYEQISEARESDRQADRPMSLGGSLPVSRKCFNGRHDECPREWTQYPDQSGPCQCECHQSCDYPEPRSVAPDAYTRTSVYLGERRDV